MTVIRFLRYKCTHVISREPYRRPFFNKYNALRVHTCIVLKLIISKQLIGTWQDPNPRPHE